MSLSRLTKELLDLRKKYGKIIVGVDFDGTIFPYTADQQSRNDCDRNRILLKKLKPHIHLCLYTVADKSSLIYKAYIMKGWGLKPDYINESPIKFPGGSTKPFFNVLLDDKAGMNEIYGVLQEFLHEIDKL